MRFPGPAAVVLAVVASSAASRGGRGAHDPGGGGAPTPHPPVPAPAVHVTGPPPGHTGGFGEPTCRACHEGDDLNAFGGSVSIEGLPARWESDRTYALAVVLKADETAAAGFQLSARFGEGERHGLPAGTLAGVSGRVAVTAGDTGQPYAHHTRGGTEPPDDRGSRWTVEWTAPATGGTIVFNVAANSANGDNSPLLDLIYAAEARVEPAREPAAGNGGAKGRRRH